MSILDAADELEVGEECDFPEEAVTLEFGSLADMEKILHAHGCTYRLDSDTVWVKRIKDDPQKMGDDEDDDDDDDD